MVKTDTSKIFTTLKSIKNNSLNGKHYIKNHDEYTFPIKDNNNYN